MVKKGLEFWCAILYILMLIFPDAEPNGRPITEITPIKHDERILPSWKKPGLRLTIKGISLTEDYFSGTRKFIGMRSRIKHNLFP